VAVGVALLGGGAKPTVLPILVGAVGLSAVFLLMRDRRLPARVVVAGLLLVASGVGTMLTVAGSTSGSRLQLLSVLKSSGDYTAATGDTTIAGEGGLVLPALAHGAVVGTLVLFCLLLINQATAAVGFGVLGRLRREPVAWFLLGALIAGWAGYLLIDHPSVSESYFIYTATPFGLAAATWLAATLAQQSRGSTHQLGGLPPGMRGENPPSGGSTHEMGRGGSALRGGGSGWTDLWWRRRLVGAAVGAVVLAMVYAGVWLLVEAKPSGSRGDQLWLVARPLVAVLALTVVLVVLWRLLVRRSAVRSGGLLVVLTLLAIVPIKSFVQSAVHGDSEKAQTFVAPRWWVYPDEESAALWLRKHSKPTDVVATNTWCRPAGKQTPGCDARGYIVSGLAGRRTLIEGWAYTNQAMAEQGVGGKRYTEQPSPWPERVALTNQALAAPTPELLRRLREEYGVRWLYADARDGTVSPTLDRLATLRHSVGKVRIYDLGE